LLFVASSPRIYLFSPPGENSLSSQMICLRLYKCSYAMIWQR